MNLAENLKKIRKDNNLSQEQLAESLGVSRQSVSKWESNQAYPEMDKVIQLANMFNLNIDDLLNQDIREINNEKQSKIAINKYIDDFLNFITKTIDMLSSMKFKDKCKCIFEQCIIISILMLSFYIVGLIFSDIFSGLLSILPVTIINIIMSTFSSIYLIISLILGAILLIHIFKVRYLDYYVIVKESESSLDKNNNEKINIEKENDEITKEPQKVYLEKKKEKIVIRDPKHSNYRFITGMLKCLLFFLKITILMIALTFCITLICFVLSLVISFLIIKTGLFFWGIFLAILSCIIINIIILIILFDFIINKKAKKKLLLITFIISLVLCGIGIGISVIGFTNFDYIDDISNSIYQEDELTIPMNDKLILHYYLYNDNIDFIEEDRQDIRIVYKHTKYYQLQTKEYDNEYLFLDLISTNNNFIDFSRDCINDINNKKIINYSKIKLTIYTSKENIDKLKNNQINYQERIDYYDMLEEQNSTYESKIYEYENTIYDLQETIRENKEEIKNLQEQLNNYDNE